MVVVWFSSGSVYSLYCTSSLLNHIASAIPRTMQRGTGVFLCVFLRQLGELSLSVILTSLMRKNCTCCDPHLGARFRIIRSVGTAFEVASSGRLVLENLTSATSRDKVPMARFLDWSSCRSWASSLA
jgi:hypothetical protein